MAGEVQESFSMNFQADSIHSGSISFGRFENEPLSWEKRSSFSHNRYLEEVEKCSKPGLVIEKKAYFEAHFKKKGLFGILPSASADLDGSERATSETDSSERIGKQEDLESNDGHYVQCDRRSEEDFEQNEDGHYVQIEKTFQDDFEPNEYDHYVQFDQGSQDEGGFSHETDRRSKQDFEPNECYHFVQFGEIPVDSDYHGECQVNEYEKDSFSSLQLEMESAINSCNDLEDATKISINFDEANQSEDETSNIISAHEEAITEVKKDDDDTVNTDKSSTNMSVTVNEPAKDVEESILHDPVNPSPKESKLEPHLNSEVNNVRVRKSASSRSAKEPARTPNRENPRRTNMEKNLSKVATPTTCSTSKKAKEVSKSGEKLIREIKSENVSRVKKNAESQPSVSKTASKGSQESERLNRDFNSSKSNVRPRPSSFNFKSSERAERRKEFYMKLEEKLQAKEAEMNQMQAISQEKTEADIKKLRKSLNFKATPMPSFYRTTSPSHSQGNKAASNNTRSRKLQSKPICQRSVADSASLSKSKKGKDQAAEESLTATEPYSIPIEDCAETNASETSLMSPAPSTNHRSHANSVTNNHGKKEQAKVAPQKHRESGSCKGNKNGESSKHRNEISRNKGARNVGLRSSSRSGNLVVRVAS